MENAPEGDNLVTAMEYEEEVAEELGLDADTSIKTVLPVEQGKARYSNWRNTTLSELSITLKENLYMSSIVNHTKPYFIGTSVRIANKSLRNKMLIHQGRNQAIFTLTITMPQ
ncbi:hypothetical protein G6F56_003471 [Rhizopus delemar]|nr:hypothetical protein G6F56_003471 [Rhizopus delemar]